MSKFGNAVRTGAEMYANGFKATAAAALLGIAGGAIANQIGLHVGPEHIGQVIGNVVRPALPFLIGAGVGIAQNALLIRQTLKNLGPSDDNPEGLTSPGNYRPIDENENTLTYSLECVDRRIVRKSAAYPGATTQFGAPLASIGAAVLTKAAFPDNAATDSLIGYHLGNNLLTTLGAHIGTALEVIKISQAAKKHAPEKRVAIKMHSHWDGCGAQGFTNIPSYFAKFKFHNPGRIADVIGMPNELLGYIYVNGILSPLTALLSGGRVSLSAAETHSQIDTFHGDHQPGVSTHGEIDLLRQ